MPRRASPEVPSAVTSSSSVRVSQVRPYFRPSTPCPPPRVSPAIPRSGRCRRARRRPTDRAPRTGRSGARPRRAGRCPPTAAARSPSRIRRSRSPVPWNSRRSCARRSVARSGSRVHVRTRSTAGRRSGMRIGRRPVGAHRRSAGRTASTPPGSPRMWGDTACRRGCGPACASPPASPSWSRSETMTSGSASASLFPIPSCTRRRSAASTPRVPRRRFDAGTPVDPPAHPRPDRLRPPRVGRVDYPVAS